ncbi:unnamed protein product, partial [Discosporangium mesarthrocarpum]
MTIFLREPQCSTERKETQARPGAGEGGGNSHLTSRGVGEEPLPTEVASVLWDLECCMGRAHETLISLQDRRPNHFGIFRVSIYAQELCMLDMEIRELVEEARNPREDRNASMGSVKSTIRNCMARLWWSKRVGDDTDRVDWSTFFNTFQHDYGQQPAEAALLFRKHLATRACSCVEGGGTGAWVAGAAEVVKEGMPTWEGAAARSGEGAGRGTEESKNSNGAE